MTEVSMANIDVLHSNTDDQCNQSLGKNDGVKDVMNDGEQQVDVNDDDNSGGDNIFPDDCDNGDDMLESDAVIIGMREGEDDDEDGDNDDEDGELNLSSLPTHKIEKVKWTQEEVQSVIIYSCYCFL